MKTPEPPANSESQPVIGVTQRSEPDIFELNLTWLLKARELARTDRGKAAVLFGLDQGLSEELLNASLQDRRNLAQSGLVLVRPRFHLRVWRQRCVGDEGASVGFALQSLMLAAEEGDAS